MARSPSAIELATLIAVRDMPGVYPASLAYRLVETGALRTKRPDGRMKAQGAGMIGGSLLARTYKAGWTYQHGGGHRITREGLAAIEAAQSGGEG